MLVAPATPVIVALAGRVALAPSEKQDADSAGVVEIAMPEGKASVSACVRNIGVLLGLLIVMVSTDVPGEVAVVGLNDLVTVGGSGGATQLPASPTAVPLWTSVLLIVGAAVWSVIR